MGNTLNEPASKFSSYQEVNTNRHDWCGDYHVLALGPRKDQYILKKTIYLRSHEQAKSVIKEYQETENPQFYLRHPLGIQLDDSERMCSLSQTIHVYHDKFYPNLAMKMNEQRIKHLKQYQIWFILSEIVHGLDILYERSHPHLWLSPSTIYYNKNENWFIDDIYYWQGPNYESFLKYKLYSNSLLSTQTKMIIQSNQLLDIRHAIDEDTYCLGYCVLYMMSGVDPTLAKNNLKRIFEECEIYYSKKLLFLVRNMIEQFSENRITMQKLRYRLKADQQSIIAHEVEEFQIKNYQRQRMSTGHEKEQTVKRVEILKTPTKPIRNIPQTSQMPSLQNSTLFSNKLGQMKYSEEQPTYSLKKRNYYSPVHGLKKKTSEFVVHSPRF